MSFNLSGLTYIASDTPLKEVQNPHMKQLSVNQALEIGIDVPDFLVSPSFDKDQPDVLLWVDDEKNLGELTIRAFCKDDVFDDLLSEKKFFAYLEWEYTKNRAENLINYIQLHLTDAEEIELWSIWIGERFGEEELTITKRRLHIEQLTAAELEKMFNKHSFEVPECMIVSR